mgnify:CR=1 FL=1
MTTAARQGVLPRWMLPLLAAIAAVLAVLAAPIQASASTTSVAETRVGASTDFRPERVGLSGGVCAGQRLGETAPGPQIVSATGVAAKAVDELAEVAANAPKITFGHGARHLEGTGLGVEEVESTIVQRVTTAASQTTSQTGSFWGRIQIRETTIEYRAYTLPDGTINVGTYYVP